MSERKSTREIDEDTIALLQKAQIELDEIGCRIGLDEAYNPLAVSALSLTIHTLQKAKDWHAPEKTTTHCTREEFLSSQENSILRW